MQRKMTGTSDLSIVIVAYNVRKYLRRCLESLVAVDPDLEIIVVDNASSDDSASVAEGFQGIHVIRNVENGGYAKANNQGALFAHGEYLLFLNPDTEVTEQSLPSLGNAMRSNSEVGIAGPQLLNSDGTLQKSWGSLPRGIRNAPSVTLKKPYVGFVKGAALMIRTKLFRELGGFDESFFMYSEERDLAVRVWCMGMKVRAVPESRIVHHSEKSSPVYSIPGHLHLHKSQVHFIRKHCSFPWTLYHRGVLAASVVILYLLAVLGLPRIETSQEIRRKRRKLFEMLVKYHIMEPFGLVSNNQETK